MDNQIIGFGEALLDIIYKDCENVQLNPGGSVLNTLVSLGRSGYNVALITEVAQDNPGTILRDFFVKERIKLPYFMKNEAGKTALAFARLDEQRNASYSFYKDYPQKRYEGFTIPEFGKNYIFSFGSFYAIDPQLQPVLQSIKEAALAAQSVLIFDPNIRSGKISEAQHSFLIKHLLDAHIIRASDEDMNSLFNETDVEKIYAMLAPKADKLFVLTRAQQHISARFGEIRLEVKVPDIKPVSTIGAGDAFNAGLIDGLLKKKSDNHWQHMMNETLLKEILTNAIRFSAEVCLSMENYIAEKRQ